MNGKRKKQGPKLRLYWSPDLHSRFKVAVHSLGGPFAAKPTTVAKLLGAMGVSGVTTLQVKSHLQIYRGKFRQQVAFAESNQNAGTAAGKMTVGAEGSGVSGQIQKAAEVKENRGDGLDKFNGKP